MTLTQHLHQLESGGLISQLAAHREVAYIFRHALLQDAAYGSLLRQQRTAGHRAAAEALEALYGTPAPGGPRVPDALAPVLAHHYATAGEAAHAQRYYVQAGEAAYARFANAEAAEHLGQALRLALADPAAPVATLRQLYTRLGRALELNHQAPAALAVYAEMAATAAQRSAPALRLAALMARATVLSTASLVFDEAGAQAALEEARRLARALNDHAAETHINWTLMLRNTMVGGDPHERLALADAALRSARALGLREQLAYVLTDRWYALAGLSRWAEGLASITEAAALWRALGNPVMLSESLSRATNHHLVVGDFAAAEASAAEGDAIADGIDNTHMRSLNRIFSGNVAFERGRVAEAVTLMETVIAQGELTGNVTALIGTRAELALVYGFIGAPDTGLALAEAALAAGQQFVVLRPWALSAAARLRLQCGDPAAAAALLAGVDYRARQRASAFMVLMWGGLGLAQVELALSQGRPAQATRLAAELAAFIHAQQVVCLLPEAQTLHGRALLALGDWPGARAVLAAAGALAQRLGARRHLWPIIALLAEGARAANDPAAPAFEQAARAELAWLTEQVPPALRSAFRARAAAYTAVRGPTA